MRRHPGDILRASLGVIVLTITALVIRRGSVGTLETDLFRLINDLPAWSSPAFVALMQVGSLAAVAIVVVATLALGRHRLARDLAIAGPAAWILAKVVKDIVQRGRAEALLTDVVLRSGEHATGLGFPSGHVAVAAALATAAGPHLSRPVRRWLWLFVLIVAVARVHVGLHLPIDAVGGAALGWAIGATLHLLWGAPGGRASLAAVRAAVAQSGMDISEIVPADVDARGSAPFFARTSNGRELFLKVIGREQRDADVLFKAFRFLAFREIEDEPPFATPKQLTEHEAYLELLARQAGVRTPPIEGTLFLPDGAALLAQQRIEGVTLDHLPSDRIDEMLLHAIWEQLQTLRAARIAHGDLRKANVLVDRDGAPWILDFGFAQAGASDHRLTRDIAELLTSLAELVGVERAVASAKNVLGPEPLGEVLPTLQPLALSSATRHEIRRSSVLEEVRQRIADSIGRPLTPPERLARVNVRSMLLVVALGFAIHMLLPRVGELRQTLAALRSGRWEWLAVALVASAFTYVAAAAAIIVASGRSLSFWRTTLVQLASSFANRLAPAGLGGMGVNVLYLQRAGMQRPAAVAAVALNGFAGFAVHAIALPIALAAAGAYGLALAHVPNEWPILLGVAGVLAVAGVVWALSSKRFQGMRQVMRSFASLASDPRRGLLLLGSEAAITVAYVAALYASLRAFGVNAPLVHVIAAYLAGDALGAASPTPGGLGAMEAALVVGLTALGVASAPAIAAVLTFRLATYWLPIIPGVVALHALSRQRVL